MRFKSLIGALQAEHLLAGDDRTASGPGTPARTLDQHIARVVFDSRDVGPGDCFVAISGTASDGHQFIDSAVSKGATVIVYDAMPVHSGEGYSGVAFVHVSDSRKALLALARLQAGHPASHITLAGTTGTNGKTTVATLIQHVLSAVVGPCGFIGTTGYRYADREIEASSTTPSPIAVYSLLAEMRVAGCTSCSMEVSSHALDQDRVHPVDFNVAVFTNLTRDHLDYHLSEAAYLEAKKRLFDGLSPRATAVFNADDVATPSLSRDTQAKKLMWGRDASANIRYRIIDNRPTGLELELDGYTSSFRLAGRFNAANLTAAYAAAVSLGMSTAEAREALAEAPPVRGRFEILRSADGRTVVIDYAHTPDALQNILTEARRLVPESSKLWCIFGCGGDRDAGKRPEMGRIAEEMADRVVVTDDNPRTECSSVIMDDIRAGMLYPEKAEWIADRARAIEIAAEQSSRGDVVLIAGKGHETVQVCGSDRLPFDDAQVAHRVFGPASAEPTPSSTHQQRED